MRLLVPSVNDVGWTAKEVLVADEANVAVREGRYITEAERLPYRREEVRTADAEAYPDVWRAIDAEAETEP